MTAPTRPLGPSERWPTYGSAALAAQSVGLSDDDAAPEAAPAVPTRWLEDKVAALDGDPRVVWLARELADQAALPNDALREAWWLVLTALLVELDQGGSRLPLSEPGSPSFPRRVERLLADDSAAVTLVASSLVDGSASDLAGSPAAGRPLVWDGQYLSTRTLYALESEIVATLARRWQSTRGDTGRAGAAASTERFDAALADVLHRAPWAKGKPLTPNAEQIAAVRVAATGKLSVITGGPGTGKTTVVLTLLRILTRLGRSPRKIALAAPTGKAAQRLADSIRAGIERVPVDARTAADEAVAEIPAARTLHRLLGYVADANRFRYREGAPLPADVVIVDEASMIGLGLMRQLLTAVADDTSVVLLGDAEQLPSIDAGAVLRDLVELGERVPRSDSESAPVVRLAESYRMDPTNPAGRHIYRVAQRIRAGDLPAGEGNDALRECRQAGELAFGGVDFLRTEGQPDGGVAVTRGFLDAWFARFVESSELVRSACTQTYAVGDDGFAAADAEPIRALLEHWAGFRLLCYTRLGPLGVAGVNDYLHDRLRLAVGGERAPFLPGEPIVMTVNDYDRELFNGDQGVILRTQSPSGDLRTTQTLAVFAREDEPPRGYPLGSLRSRLQLAHAMTVHKAQGSEFDHVGVLLPSRESPLETREILYTALTRSRQSVTLVGTMDGLRRCVSRPLHRLSGIVDRVTASWQPRGGGGA